MTTPPLTSDLLLSAYAQGYFPMAQERHGEELFWFSPEERGIIPLEEFHIPARLARFLRRCPYRITVDAAFEKVIAACADTPRAHEKGTWINDRIIALYTHLHAQGHAHSVECWEGDALAGGLYGLSLGGAFFGESMFSHADNASKTALVALVTLLREGGYGLLDTQYVNPHLRQFGCIAISKKDYLDRLTKALRISPNPSSRFMSVAGTIFNASSLPVSSTFPPETSSRN